MTFVGHGTDTFICSVQTSNWLCHHPISELSWVLSPNLRCESYSVRRPLEMSPGTFVTPANTADYVPFEVRTAFHIARKRDFFSLSLFPKDGLQQRALALNRRPDVEISHSMRFTCHMAWSQFTSKLDYEQTRRANTSEQQFRRSSTSQQNPYTIPQHIHRVGKSHCADSRCHLPQLKTPQSAVAVLWVAGCFGSF